MLPCSINGWSYEQIEQETGRFFTLFNITDGLKRNADMNACRFNRRMYKSTDKMFVSVIQMEQRREVILLRNRSKWRYKEIFYNGTWNGIRTLIELMVLLFKSFFLYWRLMNGWSGTAKCCERPMEFLTTITAMKTVEWLDGMSTPVAFLFWPTANESRLVRLSGCLWCSSGLSSGLSLKMDARQRLHEEISQDGRFASYNGQCVFVCISQLMFVGHFRWHLKALRSSPRSFQSK